MALSGPAIGPALDMAIIQGVGPLLAGAQSHAGVSPRAALLETLGAQPAALIRTRTWIAAELSDANSFGIIDPSL